MSRSLQTLIARTSAEFLRGPLQRRHHFIEIPGRKAAIREALRALAVCGLMATACQTVIRASWPGDGIGRPYRRSTIIGVVRKSLSAVEQDGRSVSGRMTEEVIGWRKGVLIAAGGYGTMRADVGERMRACDGA